MAGAPKTEKKLAKHTDGKMLQVVEEMLKYGHTEVFVRNTLGISKDCWKEWKRKDPKFKALLHNWRDYADAQVERALFERATGGHTKRKTVTDEKGGVTETEEELGPDAGACAKWLGSRQPHKWSQKVGVEHSGSCDLRGLIGVLDAEESKDILGDLLD